jgi:hypothetical protein
MQASKRMLVTLPRHAVKAPQSRDFFKRYTEQTKRARGGDVEVLPLDIVAETMPRA